MARTGDGNPYIRVVGVDCARVWFRWFRVWSWLFEFMGVLGETEV
jgi:hypothetical protein